MSATETAASRPRYEILDGLRGVAAVLVILYHFGEAFATSPVDQMMNHGYLAVDFFFVLSGFVLGYAYDGSWRDGGMSPGRFMLRRVIRLHPMVVLAVILGALAWLLQGSVRWDGTPVSLSHLLTALALGLLLIPVWPGTAADVRGNGEMFPLNGPSWSLFFEYIGSLMYATFLHRLPVRRLCVFTAASGIALAAVAICNMSGAWHLGMGWSMADCGFVGGFLRLSFSFSAGLLLSRTMRPRRIPGAFWICSGLIAAVLSCPYVTTDGAPSVLNAVYDSVMTLVVFPAIVYIGACGTVSDPVSTRVCNTLGYLSYPVYIIHYPAMYLFYAWVWEDHITPAAALPVCCMIFVGVFVAAWIAARYYDTPVRRRLSEALSHRLRRSRCA